MRSLWTTPLARYAVIIVLLVLLGWLVRRLLVVAIGSSLLSTILVVGIVLLNGAFRRGSEA